MLHEHKSNTDPSDPVLNLELYKLEVKREGDDYVIVGGARDGEKLSASELSTGGVFTQLSVADGYTLDIGDKPANLTAVYQRVDEFEKIAYEKGMNETQQMLFDGALSFMEDKDMRRGIALMISPFVDGIRSSWIGGLVLSGITYLMKGGGFSGLFGGKTGDDNNSPAIDQDVISNVVDPEVKLILEKALDDGVLSQADKAEIATKVGDKAVVSAELAQMLTQYDSTPASDADVDIIGL